jgi:hypothetical protein
MHAHEAESLAQEQRIHGITGDTTMLTAKAELAAKRTTKLGLATAIAALCMTASLSPARSPRAAAAKSARGARRRFTSAACWPHGIRNTIGATPKFISIGPVWLDMANQNDSQSASGKELQIGMTPSRGGASNGRIGTDLISTRIRDFRECHAPTTSLLDGGQHAHVITGDTTMLTSKPKVRTKLALATAIAALSMTAVPFAGAIAQRGGYPIGAERAKALHECSGLADEWGYAYRSCMAQHGESE